MLNVRETNAHVGKRFKSFVVKSFYQNRGYNRPFWTKYRDNENSNMEFAFIDIMARREPKTVYYRTFE